MTTLALPAEIRLPDQPNTPFAQPALRQVQRRPEAREVEIRTMSQPRDLGHAWVLLARQRRWLTSIGIDVALAEHREGDDYHDPAGFYAAPDGVLLIASRRGRPIGMAGIRLTGERPRQAELRRLYVDVHERGNGLGRRLLKAAIEQARLLHADEVVLETLPGPMAAAVSLYRSMGFEDGPALGHTDLHGVVTLKLALFASARA